jgi:hypothetical protein
MGVVSQEQTMDAKAQVKSDLLHFFRTYKVHMLSRHVGPLKTHNMLTAYLRHAPQSILALRALCHTAVHRAPSHGVQCPSHG